MGLASCHGWPISEIPSHGSRKDGARALHLPVDVSSCNESLDLSLMTRSDSDRRSVRTKGSAADCPFDSRRHMQWPPLTSRDDMRQEPNRRPSSESGSSTVSSLSAFEQIYRTHRLSVFRYAL